MREKVRVQGFSVSITTLSVETQSLGLQTHFRDLFVLYNLGLHEELVFRGFVGTFESSSTNLF